MVAERKPTKGSESLMQILGSPAHEGIGKLAVRGFDVLGGVAGGIAHFAGERLVSAHAKAIKAGEHLATIPATVVRSLSFSAIKNVPTQMFGNTPKATEEIHSTDTQPLEFKQNTVGTDTLVQQSSIPDTLKQAFVKKMKADKKDGFGAFSDLVRALHLQIEREQSPEKRINMEAFVSSMERDLSEYERKNQTYFFEKYLDQYDGQVKALIPAGPLSIADTMSQAAQEVLLNKHELEDAIDGSPSGNTEFWDKIHAIEKRIIAQQAKNPTESREVVTHTSSQEEEPVLVTDEAEPVLISESKHYTKGEWYSLIASVDELQDKLEKNMEAQEEVKRELSTVDLSNKSGKAKARELRAYLGSLIKEHKSTIEAIKPQQVQLAQAEEQFQPKSKPVISTEAIPLTTPQPEEPLDINMEFAPSEGIFWKQREKFLEFMDRIAENHNMADVVKEKLHAIFDGSKEIKGVKFGGVYTEADFANFLKHPYVSHWNRTMDLGLEQVYNKAGEVAQRELSVPTSTKPSFESRLQAVQDKKTNLEVQEPTDAETKLKKEQGNLMEAIAKLPSMGLAKLTELYVKQKLAREAMRNVAESAVLATPKGSEVLAFYKKHEYIIGRVAFFGGRIALGAVLAGILNADHMHGTHGLGSHGVHEQGFVVHHPEGYQDYRAGERADYSPTFDSGYEQYRASERTGFDLADHNTQLGTAHQESIQPAVQEIHTTTPTTAQEVSKIAHTQPLAEVHTSSKSAESSVTQAQQETQPQKATVLSQYESTTVKPIPSTPQPEVAEPKITSGSVMSGRSDLEPNESDMTIGTSENWKTDERTGHTTFVTEQPQPISSEEKPAGIPENSDNWAGNSDQREVMTQLNSGLSLEEATAKIDDLLDKAMDKSLDADAQAEARREILSIIDPDRSLVTQPRATVSLMTELFEANGNSSQLQEIIERARVQ